MAAMSIPNRFSQARILVVDDAEFSLRLIIAALMKYGFTKIFNAKNGADALRKARHLKPDLVILDLEMPDLDGFDFCEQMRCDAELSSIPIIVQTAINTRAAKLRALSCGASDFVYKPFDAEELSLRARVHIERYFMLRDIQRICLSLQIEIAHAESLLSYLEESTAPSIMLDTMRRHVEVLRTMTIMPVHNNDNETVAT